MPLVDTKLTGKYRNLLIPFADLKAEAVKMQPELEALQQQYNSGSLSDAELATRFILLYGESRTGRKTAITDFEAAAHVQIKGMPGMIFTTLADWHSGKVNLRLTEKSVSAHEMLQAQAEGWRYVTVSFDHALTGEPIEGDRDAFEFALHDLGHAYAFFKADYNPRGQVEFFKALLADAVALAPYAESNAKFGGDLEYCMADMNSHPQHLGEYLRGVIVEMFLRRRAQTGESEEHNEAELGALLARLSCLKGLRPRNRATGSNLVGAAGP